MLKYKIVFAPTAHKQFMRLSIDVQTRLGNAIAKLGDDPSLGKRLKGPLKDYWSYRVGDYRVIYLIRQEQIQIEVVRVAHRRDVYR